MDCLVTGSDGLLGGNVISTTLARNWTVTGTHHTTVPEREYRQVRLDLRDDERIVETLDRIEPDLVVNCGAVTDVDACEREPQLAATVNAEAPGTIAAWCERQGAGLVHVSTDYVFDGAQTGLYHESSQPNPQQVYGETKLAGERTVRAAHSESIIVRPSFLYGIDQRTGALSGFPSWVRDQFAEGEPVPLITDQWVTPTRAGAAAEAICDLATSDCVGTFHVASRTCVTPYEFGDRIRRRTGEDPSLLEETSRTAIDASAERPADTCLDVSTIERELGRTQPTLEADLDAVTEWF